MTNDIEADTRSGDYPGRGARPQAETGLELEVG
jgi:hypothetical protein